MVAHFCCGIGETEQPLSISVTFLISDLQKDPYGMVGLQPSLRCASSVALVWGVDTLDPCSAVTLAPALPEPGPLSGLHPTRNPHTPR